MRERYHANDLGGYLVAIEPKAQAFDMKLLGRLFCVAVIGLLGLFCVESHNLAKAMMPLRGGSIGGAIGLFVGCVLTMLLADLRMKP